MPRSKKLAISRYLGYLYPSVVAYDGVAPGICGPLEMQRPAGAQIKAMTEVYNLVFIQDVPTINRF